MKAESRAESCHRASRKAFESRRWLEAFIVRGAPLLLLLITLSLTSQAAAASTPILLQGKVLDQDEEPLRGAKVTVTRVDEPSWQESATTNRKGRYKIVLVEGEKPINALVEKDGYQSTTGLLRPVVLSTDEQKNSVAGRRGKSTFEVDFRLRNVEPTPEQLAAGIVNDDIRIIAAQKAFNRGVAAAREGRTEEAVKQFEHALVADPRHRTAPFSIGKIRFDEKNYAAAAEIFLPLTESAQASPELLELTVHALKNSSQLDKAMPILDRLWQAEPQRAHDEMLEVATLYRAADDKAKARLWAEKLLKTDPENTTAIYVYARLLAAMDEPESAILYFRKFLELAPQATEAERVRQRLKTLEAAVAEPTGDASEDGAR